MVNTISQQVITPLKVAILGSGNIGSDLLIKVMRSNFLECTLFVGRNPNSSGLKRASELGVRTSFQGIQAIVDNPDVCDVVFDCTSASSHLIHWPILQKLGKFVIDMTPSHIGTNIVPAINIDEIQNVQNVNLVSCGGQLSIPLCKALTSCQEGVEYIEVVSTISSKSAGPATRLNISEYIETTEKALIAFTGCQNVKVILILNPAIPCIDMKTTIFAKIKNPDLSLIKDSFTKMEKTIQSYVPGYKITVPPTIENGRLVSTIKVVGRGDFLPPYAGNLDIITCAAVAVAEKLSLSSEVKRR